MNKKIFVFIMNMSLVLLLLQNTAPLVLATNSHQVDTLTPTYENFDDDIIELIQNLDKNTIIGFLENLTSFGPRVTGTSGCEDAGNYIYQEFNRLGLSTRHQYWNYTSNIFGSNIEATLQGCDPSSREIYIICAHYDTVSVSPGADDDGSGVAAVLATAKLLSEYQFDHTIKFVAFDGEEQGLVGSWYYVTEAYGNGDNIAGVINADMIGYASTQKGETTVIVYSDDDSRWLLDHISETCNKYNVYINLDVYDGGYMGYSDHVPFWSSGYNAIVVSEYEFTPYFHQKTDTVENMNPSYATNVTKLILATLAELAEFHKNIPPNTPSTPVGITNGATGREYSYSCVTTDPEGGHIYYQFDWGDGNLSDWIGPFPSGITISSTHLWVEQGSYEIRVKAKDIFGAESNWSDPLEISMPKHSGIQKYNLSKIFHWFLDQVRLGLNIYKISKNIFK